MSKDKKISEAYSKIKDMPRSDIRYRLYTLRSGGECDNINEVRDHYGAQPGFTKWEEFAMKWDIGKGEGEEKFKIVRKLLTEYEEWDAIVRQHST